MYLDLESMRVDTIVSSLFCKYVFYQEKEKGNKSEHIMVRLMLQTFLCWKRPELYLD